MLIPRSLPIRADPRQTEMIMGNTAPTPSDPRDEAFGYLCRRCRKCCHHKRIQLNPYEVARLARNRGLTTSAFRAAFTEDGAGLALPRTESGACVFLGGDGCTVHADRPLVCRLYPLGRHVSADGVESFSHADPSPGGDFTRSGTIAEFLATQDAYPFMRAADDYFFWLCAAYADQTSDGEAAKVSGQDEDAARDLLDMDGAIARHCAATEVAEPTDIEVRRKLHLTILYQQLGQSPEEQP
jgi:Fe-S-cluster containining protein